MTSTPRPTVVYIHGIGNKVRAELLKSQWDSALFGRDMGGASRMAYWASLRYETPLPDSRSDPLDGGLRHSMERAGPHGTEGPEEFIGRTLAEARFAAGDGTRAAGPGPAAEDALADWLRDMVYLADALAESDRTEEAGPADEPLPEALPLPRPARKAVFRLLVQHTFKDLHAYFFGGDGPAIRETFKNALEGLDGGPVVVVGHSLGSVVAYEVLAEWQGEVQLLVTVGSPLAITEVQDQLARPPAVPPGVLAWRNASDLRDLVALDHTLRPEYAPQDRVTDLLVANDSPNHHNVTQYLANQQVREPVQRIFNCLAQDEKG
ncbi:alpha/beta fold hydrolase [Streptomyces sp. NPDC101227]|uniref:alpha/beta fold hydrolase n=1 Tax=Streptomyces sp. NPDC101227 TaxID=3366136 RepID=UPI003806F61A